MPIATRSGPGPCPYLATRDAGAIAHPSEGRALTPERIAAFTVARDKPDYHVHNDPQTETSAGTRNARGVSLGGNIFAAAPRRHCGAGNGVAHESLNDARVNMRMGDNERTSRFRAAPHRTAGARVAEA
jgi:hypothetical protein